METPIAETTRNSLGAIQTAIDSASALIVAYALSVAGALVVLIVGLIAAGILERWARAGLSRVRGLDPTIVGFVSLAIKYAVLVLVMVMVLAQFGVQTTSIIAALGAAGLAIGLALQGTLQNIAAGLMILGLRPFRVGESIVAGSVSGTVQQIGLFTTDMQTADGLYLVVPNNQLWNTPILNQSRNATRRFDVEVGIGYGDDIELAKRTLLELARGDERVLPEPPPIALVDTLGATTVNVILRVWTTTQQFGDVVPDLTQAAKERLAEAGISVAPPQQVVYRQG